MKTNLAENLKVNAITITAYRAIKILKMLIEKPCSNKEIIEALRKDSVKNKSLSEDTLRATLNSLKTVGCDISRPCPANNYNYILNKHPFGLKITKSQFKILCDIRKYFLLQNDWKTVVELNNLYDKIAFLAQDEEIREAFSCSKIFTKIRPKIMDSLLSGELENKEVILKYATSSKKQTSINISVDKIFCHAKKIYLYGFYEARNEYAYFSAEKILEIESIKPKNKDRILKFDTATYKIFGKSAKTFVADEEEKIISSDEESVTVEYTVKSEFKFIQRLLSFGEDFELINSDYFKNLLKEKVQKMLARYEDV